MKHFLVLDGVFDENVLSGAQTYFEKNVRWNYGWPQGTKDPYSHWNIDFLGAKLRNQDNLESQLFENPNLAPIADMWRALAAGPMKGHHLIRCYANAHTYGVEGFPHTDTMNEEQVNNFTAVVYMNPVWKKEWAGELVIFDKAGDVFMAVLPQPGRTAVIAGEYLHAARGVSRICPAVRICIAFKTRLPS